MDTRTAEPTTVGEVLREEFMIPSALGLDDLAAGAGITTQRFSSILSNTGTLSAEEAERLGNYLGTGGDFWVNIRDAHHRWEKRMALAG